MPQYMIRLLLECEDRETAEEFVENLVLDGQESLLTHGLTIESLKFVGLVELPPEAVR